MVWALRAVDPGHGKPYSLFVEYLVDVLKNLNYKMRHCLGNFAELRL